VTSSSLRALSLVLAAGLATSCGAPPAPPGPAPLSVWHEPVTGMEFLWVPPSRFRMGSGPEVAGRQADEVPHTVTISRGFYLGRFEVTQEEWVAVMGANPSGFPECGARCPVETVSYLAIQELIERLEERSPGSRFRLPTEAEWELACRAGTRTPFSTGETLTADQANFDGRYPYDRGAVGKFRGSPAPVGSYPPNPWGFYDLHGNVWEWCEDWYGPYEVGGAGPDGVVRDPRGPEGPVVEAPAGLDGGLRVIRGGSWTFDGNSARCALRYTHRPQDDGFSLGFRLVREAVDR